MGKKKKTNKIDLEALEREHSATFSLAESFCRELTSQINRLLDDEGIVLGFPIQYRVKQWESIREKIDRVPFSVSSVKDFQDLAGLRLILLFKRDVSNVTRLISDNFTVIRQYDTQERLKQDQFGYSSMHFVVELPQQWLAVPTLAPMGELRAEIQVRTLAQHIWAAVSHTLQYKQEENVPPSVLRAIYRVSALLETVDLEFERVLEQRESYRTQVDVSGTRDLLNVDLLEKTLDSLLPLANKTETEVYGKLLDDLRKFNINTQQELRTLIEENLDNILAEESRVVARELQELNEGKAIFGTTPDRVRKGLYYTHVGLTREALESKFGEKWKEYNRARSLQEPPA